MNWYIGQEVVCVTEHTKSRVKKGQIYIIHGLSSGVCPCSKVLIDVGVLRPYGVTHKCYEHNADAPRNGYLWFYERLFVPLQTESEEADMKEAIEQSIERVFQ